jgi:hypothetical protein
VGFKKCCISTVIGETDGSMLWNGSEDDVNLRCVSKMKAMTVKMEKVPLIAKGRLYLTCFEY